MYGRTSRIKLVEAKVVSNAPLAEDIPDIFSLVLYAPYIAKEAGPGQFAMVYLNRGELLLPRPISFCDTDREKGTVTLVFQAVGEGTRVMAGLTENQSINIMGPLGNGYCTSGVLLNENGYAYEDKMPYHAVVGGGMGAAPLLLMAKALAEKGMKPDVFLGFRDKPVLIEEFKKYTDRIFISTDSGIAGHKGNILEVLNEHLHLYDIISSCGPKPMMQELAKRIPYKAVCQVSLEEHMACGLGACVGCAVLTTFGYKCVCTYGPVFITNEGEDETWING